MDYIINLELIQEPINWVVVFLVLYAAAISTHFIMMKLNVLEINL